MSRENVAFLVAFAAGMAGIELLLGAFLAWNANSYEIYTGVVLVFTSAVAFLAIGKSENE